MQERPKVKKGRPKSWHKYKEREKVGTDEINDETAVRVTAGGMMEEGFAVR